MSRKRFYYNNWAQSRPIDFSLPLFNFFHRRMLHKAKAKIANIETLKILEVGIGFGYFARAVKKLGCEYIGVEMNEKLASNLRNEGFNVIRGVVPPFPTQNDIGIIWLSHILEHCSTYLEARELVESAYMVLKPGGYIVVISPDILSWRGEFWNTDWSHGFPTTLRRCAEILKDAGFSIVFKSHHNATVFSPVMRFFINLIILLIPYNLLDLIIEPFTKRRLFYSFMTLFGWRQIYLIGKKIQP